MDVTAEQVADWQSWLLTAPRSNGRPLSPNTLADTRATLRQVFAATVDLDLIHRNPVDRVKPPKVRRAPGRVLTADEVGRLLSETDRYRYAAVAAILFTVGRRVSEVLGLAWSDVDLDAGTLHVRRAVVEGPGGRRLGPTKTPDAAGLHRLAPGVIERLHAWRVRQAQERLTAGSLWQSRTHDGTTLDLVFTQPDGSLVARQQIDKTLVPPYVSASTRDVSAPTSVGAPSSPSSSPRAPTSTTSHDTWDMPAPPPRLDMSPVSAIGPRRRLASPPSCSTAACRAHRSSHGETL